MKFLVFSDSHEYTNGLDYAIEKHKEIRHIIHCGDMACDIEYLEMVYGKTHSICGVCGNNDFRAADPFQRIFTAEGHKIFVTHGHKERVKASLYPLRKAVLDAKCSVGIFGHTHQQFLEESDGVLLLNPGSIGYFKQEYAILNIEKNDIKVDLMKL